MIRPTLLSALLLASLLAISAFASPAFAHGPTRVKLELAEDLAATPRPGLGDRRPFPGSLLEPRRRQSHRHRRGHP